MPTGTSSAELPNVVTDIGPVKPHVRPVAEEIARRWVLYFIWGAPGRGTGEHAAGLALDFMTYSLGNGVDDPGPRRDRVGNEIATYLWEHRHRLNIWYVIWNDRWISTNPSSDAYNRWIPYDGDNPHLDHVHVSFREHGPYTPPEDDLPISDADARKIAAAVWTHQLDPGPYSERVGGYPKGKKYPAGGLLVGADTYGREAHRLWPKLIAGITRMAGPISEEERAAEAADLLESINRLSS